MARDRQPVDRGSEQHVQASPNQTGGPPAKFVQEQCAQWPAYRAGKAGNQGNPGDRAIPVEEYLAVWRKDPEYLAAYSAFEEESHAPRRRPFGSGFRPSRRPRDEERVLGTA